MLKGPVNCRQKLLVSWDARAQCLVGFLCTLRKFVFEIRKKTSYFCRGIRSIDCDDVVIFAFFDIVEEVFGGPGAEFLHVVISDQSSLLMYRSLSTDLPLLSFRFPDSLSRSLSLLFLCGIFLPSSVDLHSSQADTMYAYLECQEGSEILPLFSCVSDVTDQQSGLSLHSGVNNDGRFFNKVKKRRRKKMKMRTKDEEQEGRIKIRTSSSAQIREAM